MVRLLNATMFVPRGARFPPHFFNNRLEQPQEAHIVETLVVAPNQAAAIAEFELHFGVGSLQLCDAIVDIDYARFFSLITIEEYAQGPNNYVIGM